MWLKRNVSVLILSMLLVNTFINRYIITDFNTQWGIAMIQLAAIPLLYSINYYLTHRSIPNLIIIIIFASELIAVIVGFNLKTELYPEFIMLLAVIGIFYFRKKWQHR